MRVEVDRLAGFCGAGIGHRRGDRRHILEDGLAAVTELGALLHHAGGDAIDIGNFGRAKPHSVAGAHLLLLGRIGIGGRSQGGQRKARREQHLAGMRGRSGESHGVSPFSDDPAAKAAPSEAPDSCLVSQKQYAARVSGICCRPGKSVSSPGDLFRR